MVAWRERGVEVGCVPDIWSARKGRSTVSISRLERTIIIMFALLMSDGECSSIHVIGSINRYLSRGLLAGGEYRCVRTRRALTSTRART
jgi:hypothetical protein